MLKGGCVFVSEAGLNGLKDWVCGDCECPVGGGDGANTGKWFNGYPERIAYGPGGKLVDDVSGGQPE
jgi:hypothetical protein